MARNLVASASSAGLSAGGAGGGAGVTSAPPNTAAVTAAGITSAAILFRTACSGTPAFSMARNLVASASSAGLSEGGAEDTLDLPPPPSPSLACSISMKRCPSSSPWPPPPPSWTRLRVPSAEEMDVSSSPSVRVPRPVVGDKRIRSGWRLGDDEDGDEGRPPPP